MAQSTRKEAGKKSKRGKKIVLIAACIVCAAVVLLTVVYTVIIPEGKYRDAAALLDAGKTDEACALFLTLGNYKDAADQAGSIRLAKNGEQLKNAEVGSYIPFGVYEQDNNAANGKEDVEWLVLDVKDGKALVISKHILDSKQYNRDFEVVTWEDCSLRAWLNDDFINTAFSSGERAMIPTVTSPADENPDYSSSPGNATQDQVFLLSIPEANAYFSSEQALQCASTDYAVARGVNVYRTTGNSWWWLRTSGCINRDAAGVYHDGDIVEYGFNVDYVYGGIRPAMWIDLNA